MGCGGSTPSAEPLPAPSPAAAQKYAVATAAAPAPGTQQQPRQQTQSKQPPPQQRPAQAAPSTETPVAKPKKTKKIKLASSGAVTPAASPAAAGSTLPVPSPPHSRSPSLPPPVFSPSSRIVCCAIAGTREHESYTGAGTQWGQVKGRVQVCVDTPIYEAIVLSSNISGAENFWFGLSPTVASLGALPGSIPGSIAWIPSKGAVMCNSLVLAQPVTIVPQPGDRVGVRLDDRAIRFELNGGTVCRVPLPNGVGVDSSAAADLCPNVALIGGASITLFSPCTLSSLPAQRSTLESASKAYFQQQKESTERQRQVQQFMRKASAVKQGKIDLALTEVRHAIATGTDETSMKLAAANAQIASVSAAEQERILLRAVKLKLIVLRALACPTRKAIGMWRKCLEKGRARRASGGGAGGERRSTMKRNTLLRTASIKPSPSSAPTTAPVSSDAPATSSFRTVPKTKQLSPTLFLDQYEGRLPGTQLTSYEWIVRNEGEERLIVEMNFSKCKGLDLHGESHQKSVVRSHQTKMIACITQENARGGYMMSYGISCTELPPDETDLKAAIQVDEAEIAHARTTMEQLRINTSLPAGQKDGDLWSHVMQQLAGQPPEVHFLDLSFPPTAQSVWSQSPSGLQRDLPLTWRRLHSFLPPASSSSQPPSFFLPSVDPNDVAQGRLGNCWFCSALSALAETPELVARLFGEGEQQVNERGVYTVRMCITGVWQTIVIDDTFPCYPSAGPIFTKNHGSQLWCLMLEKTFAKVHGGYDRLTSGQAHFALADLTGYPVKSYQLESADTAPLLKDGGKLLWNELREWAREDLSTCAGTIGKEHANNEINVRLKSVGLIAGHAYSLLDCFVIPHEASTSAGVRLLELRNPWGQGEWTGAWSDNSPLWTPELIKLLKPNINATVEDGIFYMCFEDFLTNFATVSTCFIRSPRERQWHEKRFSGVFRSTAGDPLGITASGALPQEMYHLTVTKECDAWTVIYQQDTRLPGASPLIDQAIMLVRVETEYGEDDMADPTQRITLISDTKIESNRQTNAPCHLVPGEYLILPYTTGTRVAKGQERGFTVAFFADEPSATKSLAARPYDVEIYTGALCELLRTTGKKSVMGKDSQLWMHELRHGASHIYACAIDPASPRSFSVTLDSAASQNARSHHESAGASSVVQRTVAPGELLLFHHLAPVQESQMTNYNADIKFKAVKPAKE